MWCQVCRLIIRRWTSIHQMTNSDLLLDWLEVVVIVDIESITWNHRRLRWTFHCRWWWTVMLTIWTLTRRWGWAAIGREWWCKILRFSSRRDGRYTVCYALMWKYSKLSATLTFSRLIYPDRNRKASPHEHHSKDGDEVSRYYHVDTK